MTAQYLLMLFDSTYLIALTAWVGSILFFSFGVAPIIFRVLGVEAGGRFVRALFPRYYLWGVISGAVALPSLVAGPLCFPEYRGPMIGVQALAIIGCALIMLYAGNALTPEINRARDAGPSGQVRFEQLHRRSVRLNGLVLMVGLGLLIGFATRRTPRTLGIIEKSPTERLRYDAAVSRVMREAAIKHGLRPASRETGEAEDQEPVIDEETVKEIDSIYAQKRLRDVDRARRRGATAGSAGARPPTAPPGDDPGAPK